MSKNSKVLAGALAAITVCTAYKKGKKKAKKYGQPLNKFDFSLEKAMNYASKGLDLAEKHFNKQNEMDALLDKAEKSEPSEKEAE